VRLENAIYLLCFDKGKVIMTRLQKQAWLGLAVTAVCVVIAGTGVGLMVHFNTKGIVGLMTFLIGCLIIGLVSCLRSIKEQAKLDEREKKIVLKAFIISSYAFVLFICFASFIVFYIIGARGTVSVYILPVIFLVGLFISQFIQSAVILIQFAREQADGQ